jgi:hypothetical protein
LAYDDIERVGEIFMKVFRGPAARPPLALLEYLQRVYLECPWGSTPVESLVNVRTDGRVDGFVGVIPLNMRVGERRLRASVMGAIMVEDADISPMACVRMELQVFAKSRELTFTDTANRTSLLIGKSLKMDLQPLHSLEWIKVFRPASLAAYLASKRWRRLPRALALRCGGMADPLIQRFLPGDEARRPAVHADQPMTREAFIAAAPRFVAGFALRPDWTPEELDWLIETAALKTANGELRLRGVTDLRGDLIGCYAIYASAGSVAYVLQLLATEKSAERVLASAIAHAEAEGCLAARGVSQPHTIFALYRAPGVLFRHNAAMMTRTRDPEVAAALAAGDAFLGGFVGESWTRLISDAF